MIHKKTHNINILKKYSLLFLVTLLSFMFQLEITAQEKVHYLKHRYDGNTEIITKDFTRKKLRNLKDKLAREGIVFNFSKLKYNHKKEIVSITLTLKNKKSKCTGTWQDNTKPIPTIKTGESFGLVYIASTSDFVEEKNELL